MATLVECLPTPTPLTGTVTFTVAMPSLTLVYGGVQLYPIARSVLWAPARQHAAETTGGWADAASDRFHVLDAVVCRDFLAGLVRPYHTVGMLRHVHPVRQLVLPRVLWQNGLPQTVGFASLLVLHLVLGTFCGSGR